MPQRKHRSRATTENRAKPRSTQRRKRIVERQAELPFRSWGGARKGAGRKRMSERPQVPHRTRCEHKARFPVIVTSRLIAGLPSLRRSVEAECVLAAIATSNAPVDASSLTSRSDPSFRIVHHSIQSNHLHLIVEAADRVALTAGMRGFLIRLARALNRNWKRSGCVFSERFHERELHSPREVRNALVYVLNNSRKHDIRHAGPDPLSSGPQFDGWLTDEDKRRREHLGRTELRSHFVLGRRPGEPSTGPRGPRILAVPSGSQATRLGGYARSQGRMGREDSVARAARTESPRATTWLLGQGWKRHGLIDLFETPRGS